MYIRNIVFIPLRCRLELEANIHPFCQCDFVVDFEKNELRRKKDVCANPYCGWIAYCARDNKLNTYQLKLSTHNILIARTSKTRLQAGIGQEFLKTRLQARIGLPKKLESRLVTQPDLRRTQTITLMNEDFMLRLEKKKVSTTLKFGGEAIEGSEEKKYGQLRDYLGEVHKTNTGSTVVLEVHPIPESPPMFNRLFICLNACKEGRQKGLEPAISEVMSRAHHRNYVLYIWKNYIKSFKDKKLRGVVKELVKCTTGGEFNTGMRKLKDKHLMAWSFLNNLEPSSGVKEFYSHWPKVNNITNNMC
ncbi:hypothetical protein Lal_00037943 [Lupinus albus]|nr:hypothetical protein Lal_00037943 [Lupinus albus]